MAMLNNQRVGDKNSLNMIFLFGVPDIHWDDPRRKLGWFPRCSTCDVRGFRMLLEGPGLVNVYILKITMLSMGKSTIDGPFSIVLKITRGYSEVSWPGLPLCLFCLFLWLFLGNYARGQAKSSSFCLRFRTSLGAPRRRPYEPLAIWSDNPDQRGHPLGCHYEILWLWPS